MNRTILFLISILILVGCQPKTESDIPESRNPELIHAAVKKLTDVSIHDIFSPPVASRIYLYPNIAAYEVMVNESGDYKTLAGQLRDLEPIPSPEDGEKYSYPLAALEAYMMVGKSMIFSEESLQVYAESLHQKYSDMGLDSDVIERSIVYGKKVADHILEWSGKDMYKETRTFPKFTITEETDRWQPTPPAYMDAIEPHWNRIRPLVIDSADQFQPELPTDFDLAKSSTFYKEVIEVYEVGNKLDEEQTEIASFWDCNPFVMEMRGHVMLGSKKITPGGHWIGITTIACRMREADFMTSVAAYTYASIALFDGFISCWDEKYRSNLIRPETVINEYIDQDWKPLLQTPPFPEYTSGHSVISRAAATVLTDFFGDNFQFSDTTEVEYGLPVRDFNSFFEASEEAAISRLYGGIHYMPAIDNGVEQGGRLGDFIVDKIKLK